MRRHKSYMKAALASASILSLSQAAIAQDSDPNNEVIATGIRQSLQNALVEKRDSDSLIEVILAEDIGKLPDQNLAEVLENITGIQITRSAGVGTGVQIRGANENRIEINGVTTLGSGTGRNGINFEDVSAAIIAGVEVIKAPEAKTIEGAIGGTINLRTIRPLDLDEDETLATVRLQFEDSSLSTDGLQPRVEGTFGKVWSNASGQEIGIVLSGSYTQQDTTAFRPRAEADGDNIIDLNRANPGTTAFDFLNPQFFVQDIDNFEAENINFAGSIEAKPTNNITLFGDVVVNSQEREQESSRVQFSGIANNEAALAIANDPNSQFQTIDFGSIGGQQIGTIELATVGTVIAQADGTDGNLRFSSDTGSRLTDSVIVRLGGEWEKDALTARFEFSDVSSDTESPSFNTTLNFINPNSPLNLGQLRANQISGMGNSANENGTPFLFDLTDGNLTFGVSGDAAIGGVTSAQLLDPSNIVLRDVQQNFDETENSETALRADISYDFEDSSLGNFLSSVDVGYRYNDTESAFQDVGESVGFRSIDQSPSGDFFSQLLVAGPDNFDAADGRALFVPDFLVIDPELTNSDPSSVLDTLNAAILANNAQFGFNGNTIDAPTVNQVGSFTINEETHSLYGQANFDFGIVRGNAGVRYVETDVVSTGTTVLNGVSSLVETDNSYDFFLPRLNLVVEPVEDVLIRAAFSQDIRRPDFGDLNTSVSFSTSPNPTVSLGNIELAPQEVDNYELGAEWFFAPGAVFSVGYFRKERDGLFVPSTENPVETFTQVLAPDGTVLASGDVRDITAPCEGGGIFNPIADQNEFAPFDAAGSRISGTGVCVGLSSIINDPGSTNQQGIEVALQYDLSNWEDRLGWASGFGLIANYTYQEFSGTESVLQASGSGADIFAAANPGATNVEFTNTLLDNSENAYNVTVFYEKYGLSGRLRYTWRDSFRTLDTAAGASIRSTLGFPVVNDSRGQLNGSINYDVNDHFTIGVEGVNLTESDINQRCGNSGGPVCFQNLTERRIIFGGTYRF